MFQYPISSPHMMRMFGFFAVGISFSCARNRTNRDALCGEVIPRDQRSDHSAFSDARSAERSDLKLHADDRRDADDKKEKRRNQGERHREDSLAVDEPGLAHRLPQAAKPEHELDMVEDAQEQHQDAERDQREAEVTRRGGPGYDLLLPQS